MGLQSCGRLSTATSKDEEVLPPPKEKRRKRKKEITRREREERPVEDDCSHSASEEYSRRSVKLDILHIIYLDELPIQVQALHFSLLPFSWSLCSRN